MTKKNLLLSALFFIFYTAAAAPSPQPAITGGAKYISPNNDGVQDTLIVNFTIKEKRYITEWHLYIMDKDRYLTRVISNKDERPAAMNFAEFWRVLFRPKRSVAVPRSVVWDGCDERGYVVPNGVYSYYMTAKNDNGLTGESELRTVVVDCTPPEISLQSPQDADKYFGGGSKVELRISQRGAPTNMSTDRWTGTIVDARGQIHRTFVWEGDPAEVRWHGEDDAGFPVPDGLYYYTITGVDLAGNRSAPVRVNNIVYSGDKPETSIMISGGRYFSNNPESPQKTITLVPSIPEPLSGNLLKDWKIEIIETGGKGRIVRSWPVSIANNRVPRSVVLDGTDGEGHLLADGGYIARVSAVYLNGYSAPPSATAPFYLKSAPPEGVITVREPKNRVFSPGSGTGREYIIFDENLEMVASRWRAEIRSADGRLVRSFDRGVGEGRKPVSNFWDGFDEAGALCADGDYRYSIYAVDLAGNPSRVTPVNFSIDTQRTELLLRAAPFAFSPNGDGVQDTVSITPLLKTSGIESYALDIAGNDRRVVKSVSGNGMPPAQFLWDGKDNSGLPAPDNRYTATLRVVSRNSNAPITASAQFLLKARGPQAVVNAEAYMPAQLSAGSDYVPVFSPDGDGRKDTIHIDIQTTPEEEWAAVITDSDGKVVWRRSWHNTNVPSFAWDGADDAGNIVNNGKYTFTLGSTDVAGNSVRVSTKPIVVDRRPVSAGLTAASNYLAPYGRDKVQRWAVNAPVKDGIQSWTFAVYPAAAAGGGSGGGGAAFDARRAVKTVSGDGDTLPSSFEWDGRAEGSGTVYEGEYAGALNIIYWKGNVAAAQSAPFLCTGTPPQLAVSTSPEYFSPDNDGVDDELSVHLRAQSVLPLSSWEFTIYDYSPETARDKGKRGAPFWNIKSGSQTMEGKMSLSTVWNGRSNAGSPAGIGGRGELVQSATDYPYAFTVTDAEGQTSVKEGLITVDVLVIRDGGLLRIQVPAITFRGDAADFNGLASNVLERNNWILGRIARALNRFKEYTVLVEGHANPVLGTKEEEAVLLSLSAARAAFVKQALGKLGISGSRLSTEGVGASRPIPGVSPRDSANNWKNRRVEFILNK